MAAVLARDAGLHARWDGWRIGRVLPSADEWEELCGDREVVELFRGEPLHTVDESVQTALRGEQAHKQHWHAPRDPWATKWVPNFKVVPEHIEYARVNMRDGSVREFAIEVDNTARIPKWRLARLAKDYIEAEIGRIY